MSEVCSIQVLVEDESAVPILGASVVLKNHERQTAHTKTAGADGSVLFDSLSRGDYQVEAKAHGYHWESREETLIPKWCASIVVVMTLKKYPDTVKVGDDEEMVLTGDD